MDSRIHGKEIKFSQYNLPPYTKQIELLIIVHQKEFMLIKFIQILNLE